MNRLLVLSCFVLSFVASIANANQAKPNIVLILADDVGCEPLGCYGGESYKTPKIDRLAAEGMRFTHCYAMPVCHPTRIALLTGRYPFRLKNPRWGSFPKQAEKQTIAHALKNAGYATAVAGKWQLTMMKNDLDHPKRLGFDQWCLFGWHEGPRYYQPMLYQNGKLRDDVKDQFGPDVYCDFLIDFMKSSQKKKQPFFAFYSMALCHDVTDDLKKPVPYGPGKERYDTYEEMVHAMDRCVGRIVDAVDQLELGKDTVIMFTGDNGTAKNSLIQAVGGKYIRYPVYSMIDGKRVRGGKGNLSNDGTNVPLIVRWPGAVKASGVSADLVDISDFFATCVEIGGGENPSGVKLDSHSFAPALVGNAGSARKWAYAEHRGKYWVRNQRWKLYDNGRLFDVANDVEEKKPIPTKRQSKEAARARRELQAILDNEVARK